MTSRCLDGILSDEAPSLLDFLRSTEFGECTVMTGTFNGGIEGERPCTSEDIGLLRSFVDVLDANQRGDERAMAGETPLTNKFGVVTGYTKTYSPQNSTSLQLCVVHNYGAGSYGIPETHRGSKTPAVPCGPNDYSFGLAKTVITPGGANDYWKTIMLKNPLDGGIFSRLRGMVFDSYSLER